MLSFDARTGLTLEQIQWDPVCCRRGLRMVMAYVTGKVNSGSETTVKEAIAELKGVKKVSLVYGDVDFIAELDVNDLIKLRDVTARMRTIEGVLHTTTYLVREER
jgi:DNA-binding Lrp family transcriptional regulator